MNDTPFCEWKLKAWIIPLVLFAVGVLAFSFWSALDSGRVRMDGYHLRLGQRAAGPPMGPRAAPLPSSPLPGPVAQMSNPAAQLVAQTNIYSQYPPWQGTQNRTTSDSPSQLDAVTMPTPMGGIKFIGGTRPVGDVQLVAGTPVGVQHVGSSPNFTRVADTIRPCVVDISAIRSSPLPVPVADPNGPRFIDPFDGIPERFVGRMAFESVGSGVIVDRAGYVVTNHHVVAGASTIIVTRFHQEGHYSARIVASDPSRDLALLQILGEGPFPAASLANSSRVEVGDWVLTVGSPFGLGHTVTAGIISGKRNSLLINGIHFKGLLQTDAPINKGSSGGPLVNMAGQVVGINCAIYAPTGVFNGTGFAIPSNQVGAFVARYIEHGRVTVAVQTPNHLGSVAWQALNNAGTAAVRAPNNLGAVWLGIGVIDMTADLAAKLSYPHAGGVYVSSLVLDSPADEAEITRGDIITAVAGQPVQDCASVQSVVARLTPGQTLSVTIWRSGKTESLRLTTRVNRTEGA